MPQLQQVFLVAFLFSAMALTTQAQDNLNPLNPNGSPYGNTNDFSFINDDTATIHLNGVTATNPQPYAEGDLFLSIGGATGTSNAIIVDLGNISTYAAVAPGATISIANFKADIDQDFGSSWASGLQSNARWSILGQVNYSGNADGSFANGSEFISGQPGAVYANPTQANQFSSYAHAQYAGQGGLLYGADPYAILASSPGDPFAFHGNLSAHLDIFPGTDNTAAFSPNGQLDFSSLVLYAFQGNGAGGVLNQAPTDLGAFTFDAQGNLSYTAVPEPSICALALAGLGLMALLRLVTGNRISYFRKRKPIAMRRPAPKIFNPLIIASQR